MAQKVVWGSALVDAEGPGAINGAEERRAEYMAMEQATSEQEMQKMAEQRQQLQKREDNDVVMARSLLELEASERSNRLGMARPE